MNEYEKLSASGKRAHLLLPEPVRDRPVALGAHRLARHQGEFISKATKTK
jgi:hypothetical protein